jgi:hypothetical protein
LRFIWDLALGIWDLQKSPAKPDLFCRGYASRRGKDLKRNDGLTTQDTRISLLHHLIIKFWLQIPVFNLYLIIIPSLFNGIYKTGK